NFRNLNHPRLDMVWVALAGPVTNILLALAAAVCFHALPFVPADYAKWVAVGLLPRFLAYPLARLEPYGMLILIGALILLPLLGAQLGLNLDVISTILRTLTGYVLGAVLFLTGNT